MKIPCIVGDYKPLFRPTVNGVYVNDHCIVKKDEKYHLFGITSQTGKPCDERFFVHAAGESLDTPFEELGRSIDKGTLAWSPCVTEHNGDYYMHYGPSPTSLAVSPDLFEWFGYPVDEVFIMMSALTNSSSVTRDTFSHKRRHAHSQPVYG